MKSVSRTAITACERSGGALVLALVCVLVVSAFAASFLQLSTSISRRQLHATATREAFYLAEAGLAEAYTGLAEARTGNIGTPEEPAVLGDGLFWVEATELAPGLVELECTALCSGGRITLGMAVQEVETGVASLGVFALDSLVVQPSSLIDGYDSRLGSYEDQVLAGTNAQMGLIGTNGDVTVNGGPGTTIDGDVEPGVGGSLSTAGSTTITGQTLPRLEPASLPAVDVPSAIMLPPIHHTGAVPLLIPAGDNAYERLEIGPEAEVVVQGPGTLVLGSLEMAGKADLTFDTTAGTIDVFVEHDFVLGAGATVSTTGDDPSRLRVQLAAGELDVVELAASTDFFGSIYAPEASVEISSDFELFGVVSARELSLASDVRLHFDRALVDGGGAGGGLPTLLSWRVVDIPDQVALRGGDPFRLLGVNRSSLPMPSEAHEDQWLVISYLDKGGQATAYEGWESGFDWFDVGKVVSASRDGEAIDPSKEPTGPTAQDQALMDFINDPKNSTGAIKTELLANSPLSDIVLNEAIIADQMSTGDLKDVLIASSPLSPEILTLVLDGTAKLSSGDKQAVLDAQ